MSSLSLLRDCRSLTLDLETTGRDHATARIWQIAMSPAFPEALLVNPGCEIPADVVDLCGLTPDKLRDVASAPEFSTVAKYVSCALEEVDIVVTYNGLRYDEPCLRRHLEDAGASGGMPPVVDVKVWAKEEWPWGTPNHSLGIVYAGVFGRGFQAHDALADCGATDELWAEVRRRKQLDGRTLRAVLAFQETAAALQARDAERFGQYVRDEECATCQGAAASCEGHGWFQWLWTCRSCAATGEGTTVRANVVTSAVCRACVGSGYQVYTLKQRGKPLTRGYARAIIEKAFSRNLPVEVRRVFETLVRGKA